MQTLLDDTEFDKWVPEQAILSDGVLKLVLIEASVATEVESVEVLPGHKIDGLRRIAPTENSRRVIVQFDDVLFLQVLGEVAHKEQSGETRDKGIVALHRNSTLLEWLKESTFLFESTAESDKLAHYSVLTAEDFYHVVSRERPNVYEAKPA